MSSVPDDPITFTCTLEARRETVYFLARLIQRRCAELGTRRQTRVLGPFRQSVLVLRWFLDGTRIRQLAADNSIATSTAYLRLHEAIDLLAALAPDAHEAPFRGQGRRVPGAHSVVEDYADSAMAPATAASVATASRGADIAAATAVLAGMAVLVIGRFDLVIGRRFGRPGR